MDDHTKSFGEAAAQALIDAQVSLEPSTKGSNSSENEHKRRFLQTFRRWERLFKRKDGDVQSDKWLIAEYYKSLSHLTAEGMDTLTDVLKETCVFFPTIKECLDVTRCGQYDYAHPFHYCHSLTRGPAPRRLIPPAEQIEYHDG